MLSPIAGSNEVGAAMIIHTHLGQTVPGAGPLFSDPDADKPREFFRQKNKALRNKVRPLNEAISRFLHDGDYLAMGGFGANCIPTAACLWGKEIKTALMRSR